VDVVVVDLKMPVMDGLEVLRRIEKTRPELPAILLTGHGTTAAGLEALREGAFDFLLKPISPERLVLEIEAAVQKSRDRQEAAQPQGTEG
jgi:DNA-binding NtrC family response regulator